MLLFLASVFACVVLFPSEAFAEWVTEAPATTTYEYVSATLPTTFKVAPTNGNTACTNLINGDVYWTGSSSAKGPCWNTVPSGTQYLVRMHSVSSGALAEGNVIQVQMNGFVRINATTNSSPSYETWTISRSLNATNYRYWVSKSGNTDTTEIFPNENGVFVMPFTAQYFFVTCSIPFGSSMSSYTYWYIDTSSGLTLLTERPEDQNEVAAINDQTTALKDTTGSDTVTGDTVSTTQQRVQQFPLIQMVDQFTTGIQQQVVSQDVDGTVTFPGMSLADFTIPAVTVRPMELVPEDLQNPIRMMVTFIFVQAFIRHIFWVIEAVFVIQNYGTLDVGMDTYDMGPRVKSWSSDYEIDEDLGF